MRSLIVGVFILPILLILFSCREEKKLDILGNLDPKTMPTMRTENVNTLISDSGITQYRIRSELWFVYDEVDTPYWNFPKGLYLEKFDKQMNVISSVACDSAKYFKRFQLWRLDGNVEMHNDQSDIFLTQQIFWDQRSHELYSDSFIHIERSDRIIEGLGFTSNERLTSYIIRKPTGIFPVNSSDERPENGLSPENKDSMNN